MYVSWRSYVGVAKWAGTNGPARQLVLKGTSWVEDFNLSVRSGLSRPARQLDGPKYEPACPGLLARFKKRVKYVFGPSSFSEN